ncbi:MAG: T9SS type A sorting domain-containing protein, partial [Candidatus Cloacimonetes bacterium]|nr:T9SS type A sorting domain-containing protein [Candidatus Cloacimonadota bacterium]
GEMKLEIYNVKGQKIRTLKTGFQTAGEHSIVWKGRDDNGNAVSSGIYFYRLESDDIFKIQKAVLMK